MSDLERLFEFNQDPVSTILDSSDNKTIWYRLTHVCRILGFSTPSKALETHCKKRYREIHTGKGRAAIYIQRSDVVRLTFASKKEYAEQFQDWVIDLVEEYWDRGLVISPTITREQAIEGRTQLDRILDTPNPWERMYEKEACTKAFKWFGSQFYWTYCYSWMSPEEKCKLDRVNPVINGDREQRIHQHLEQETRDRLAPHATRLVDFLISSTSKQDFQTRMGRIFGSDQQELDLG